MKKGQEKTVGGLSQKSVIAILDNIRSSHNVGSMFRTADALGVDKLFLVGYTPTPHDQFGRVNKEIAKVALGAEVDVPSESAKTISALIKKLKAEKSGNYRVVAVEQHPNAVDYKKWTLNRKAGRVAFIFGNEVDGISEKTLSLCDEIVHIPMRGKKESLNVSVAFGIALARMMDR